MNTASGASPWICCQLGAREHYAIPRALFHEGVLVHLTTDAWVRQTSPFALFSRSLRERFHPDLASAPVQAWNARLIAFELTAKARSLSGWPLIIARNEWFQRKVVGYVSSSQLSVTGSQVTLFAYSYAGLEILKYAKTQGWKTVLGQIDPGPIEEEIVQDEHEAHPEFGADWKPAPAEYFGNWRKECSLADHIIVNSEWSRAALVQGGVSGEKLSVIPLAYESSDNREQITHNYPSRFTRDRPLCVLFLGQINVRKGIARLLEAAKSLRNEPVEFWMVGPIQCHAPDQLRNLPNIRWLGRVARAEAHKYYSEADVFLLPTWSDGFALTQLEAQAHGLPVIASRCCGEVVKHGVNGLLLDEPAADAIVEALRFCLAHPGQLAAFSAASRVENRFSIDVLGANLLSLSDAWMQV